MKRAAKRPAKRPLPRAAVPRQVANLVRVSIARGAAAPGLTGATLKKRAERMLAALDLGGVEISIALVDDAAIRVLNKQWRKKNEATDVLSFPMMAFPMMDDASAATPPSTGLTLIGDVIVSTQTAVRQAAARKISPADEVTVLLAHGVLHLLGFDHGSDEEESEMDAYAAVLQAAARSRLPMRLKLVPVRPRG